MTKTSAKNKRTNRYDPNGRKIRAVQNYILGQPDITKGQALRDAGYSKSTAAKQPQIITDHPLYLEWKLAQATQVKVSKDFLNLRILKRLAGKLTFSEELKALDFLATINGYKPKEGADAPGVNIWQMLLGGNGDLTSEKDFKERAGYVFADRGGSKNRL